MPSRREDNDRAQHGIENRLGTVQRDMAEEERSDDDSRQSAQKHVEEHKARYKWITGGIEFINAIPKSPSGKILRRLLRDREKESRRKKGAKL